MWASIGVKQAEIISFKGVAELHHLLFQIFFKSLLSFVLFDNTSKTIFLDWKL